jgi:hypothetical protein
MPGRRASSFFAEFAAADAGHDDVGDEDIDVFFAGLGEAQTGFAIFGFEDLVAARGESEADEFAHRVLVFYQQNGFAAAGFVGLGLGGAQFFRRIFGARQIDVEGCALPDLALGEDVSIALLDDAVDGGEAEAGAFSFFLGGKEGFKDAGLSFLSMPWPVSETEITA